MPTIISSKCVTYIRLNQKTSSSEKFIYMSNAISSDENNVSRLIILPATYVESPRYMDEYAQNLFFTFTFNANWIGVTVITRSIIQRLSRHSSTSVFAKTQSTSELHCKIWIGLLHAHIVL